MTNLLMATAARMSEDPNESDEDSDIHEVFGYTGHAGSMNVVQRTLQGLAVGRHARTIHLGRLLWESPPLTDKEEQGINEIFFDDGTYPTYKEILKQAKKVSKIKEKRPRPFENRTKSSTARTTLHYASRLHKWMQQTAIQQEPPNEQQWEVLRHVRDRLITEEKIRNEHPVIWKQHLGAKVGDTRQKAIRGLVHGLPGTGKSKVIHWIRHMFMEAMNWEHGVEFVCVAYQNRVAYAMHGATLHAAGDITMDPRLKLQHTDIERLFIRNQALRWIIIDELFTIPDDLLGVFAHKFEDAAADSIFKRNLDGSSQIFGGYNLMMFGDMLQLPPIPSSAALFLPPDPTSKTQAALDVLEMFWGEGENTVNYFIELNMQMRVEDDWFNDFLMQCRAGDLEDEMYNFFMGFPTEHCGTWMPGGTAAKQHNKCGQSACALLHVKWKAMAMRNHSWEEMQALECMACKGERQRRNRLMQQSDPRVRQQPFLDVLYVHENKEPQYHDALLRAVEDGK
jgi:hypothetical protein